MSVFHATPLKEIPDLSERFSLPRLFLKDESAQPNGTWKDRRSRYLIERSRAGRVDALVLVTSGNGGYSLAKYAEGTGIRVVPVVDRRLPEDRKMRIKAAAGYLLEADFTGDPLSSEELISLARNTSEERIVDVTTGCEEAYEPIIEEIAHVHPDYVICPIGKGEGLLGLSQGIAKHSPNTRLVGVFPSFVPSSAAELGFPWPPYVDHFAGSDVIFKGIPEAEIDRAYRLARESFSCEPSSAIVLTALRRLSLNGDETVVLINSGNGGFISSKDT